MKLKLRPNHRKAAKAQNSICGCLQSQLPFIQLLPILAIISCARLTASSAAIPRSQINSTKELESETQFKRPNVEVSELRLVSDLRSVKLRWTYEQEASDASSNKPTSFNIRYCELTSWNIEIKCRQRDMQVDRHPLKADNSSSVIMAPIETVHQLDPPNGRNYEAQIFDLRALTNYTFHVKVARFANEPNVDVRQNRSQMVVARRLDSTRESPSNELTLPTISRIETKPFVAEATRCLSDVSEVLVSTGRYFGGRISVEDNSDPRCSLIGNKSSEQSTYLFRIDHEVCNSKVVDGNRIETMVLVHENKDILTHNTARFLVLCNFLQKSFTLKASVSLPKVNGFLAPSRAAVISVLPGRPTGIRDGQAEAERQVMLGSMPGLYRTRPSSQQFANQEDGAKKLTSLDSTNASALNRTLNYADELETNTIDKTIVRNGNSNARARQSKELSGTSRSFTLFGGGEVSHNSPPQPVRVQSGVLNVEGSDLSAASRVGRQRQYHVIGVQASEASQKPQNQTEAAESRSNGTMERTNSIERQLSQSTKLNDEMTDLQASSAPIIMTNNHRIAGNYLQVARPLREADDFSIKYSGIKVDEYPLGRSGGDEADVELGGRQKQPRQQQQLPRARSGRMRSSTDGEQQAARKPATWPVNRLGELATTTTESDNELSADDSSKLQLAANSPTLARNITNYLLEWSLKALTNLAKKSLESLVVPEDQGNNTELMVLQNETSNQSLVDRRIKPMKSHAIETNQSSQITVAPKSPVIKESIEGSQSSESRQTNRAQISLAPALTLQKQTTAEQVPDGFAINRTRHQESVGSPRENSAISNNRPSNYSKSLDFSRNEMIARQKSSERTKPNSTGRHKQPLEQQEQFARLNESARSSNEDLRRPNWPIYAFGLMATLIVVLTLTLWVTFLPSFKELAVSRADAGSSHQPIEQIVFADSALASMMCQQGDKKLVAAPQNRAFEDSTYQRYNSYNKFDNYARDTMSKSVLLASSAFSSRQSPSTGSHSTRSTSICSNSMAGEHDRKTNELHLTDHILINTGAGSGESFA